MQTLSLGTKCHSLVLKSKTVKLGVFYLMLMVLKIPLLYLINLSFVDVLFNSGKCFAWKLNFANTQYF